MSGTRFSSPTRGLNLGYSELELEEVNSTASCCCRQRVNCSRARALSITASLSLLGSIGYFGMAGYLIYTIVERSMVLFITAVVFFVETLMFGKYVIDVLMLKRDKPKWHGLRIWIPFADLVAIEAAVFAASLMLPCGTVADLWHQLAALEFTQYWLVLLSMGILGTKLLTAAVLTYMHVTRLRVLLPATVRIVDPYNYPFDTHVRPPPTAPVSDDD